MADPPDSDEEPPPRPSFRDSLRTPATLLLWVTDKCRVQITVEPIILMFMFTVYLWYPLCTELMYQNILSIRVASECRLEGVNSTECETVQKAAAQEETSRLQLYVAGCRHVPAFVAALVLGSFTDRYGRKPALLLSCVGNGIWTTFLLSQIYFKFSVYYFLLGGILDGLCGGVSTFLFASYAFIADVSSPDMRTKKISLAESMVFLGGFIASILGGFWTDKRGFAAPLFAVQFCNILILVYIVFGLKEPRKVSKHRSYKLVQHLKRTINLMISPTVTNRHLLWLAMLIFSLLAAVLAGTNNIFILFLMDKPFEWSNSNIGYFIAFNTLLNGIITLLVLPELNKHIGDWWTCFIGIVACCVSSIIMGVATQDWVLFLGSTVSSVGCMATPTLRSEMSKMVSPNSQGSLFSLMSASDVLVVLISSSLMSKIYEQTHLYYHGFCFLIEGGLAFIAIGLSISQRFQHKRSKLALDKAQLIENDPDPDEKTPPVYVMSEIEDPYPTSPHLLQEVHYPTSPLQLQEDPYPTSPLQLRISPPAHSEDVVIHREVGEVGEVGESRQCGHVTCSYSPPELIKVERVVNSDV